MKLSKKICKTEIVLRSKKVEKICWTFVIQHLMRNESTTYFSTLFKNEANKQGFITSTNNCKVAVLVSKANNKIGYHCINYTIDLANVLNAIKRKDDSKKRKLEKTTMRNQYVLPT